MERGSDAHVASQKKGADIHSVVQIVLELLLNKV